MGFREKDYVLGRFREAVHAKENEEVKVAASKDRKIKDYDAVSKLYWKEINAVDARANKAKAKIEAKWHTERERVEKALKVNGNWHPRDQYIERITKDVREKYNALLRAFEGEIILHDHKDLGKLLSEWLAKLGN